MVKGYLYINYLHVYIITCTKDGILGYMFNIILLAICPSAYIKRLIEKKIQRPVSKATISEVNSLDDYRFLYLYIERA